MNSPASQMKTLQLSMLPKGESLKDYLSVETYEKLQDYLTKSRMASPVLNRMKPGMLVMTISTMEAMKIGATPDNGVEMIFDTQAREDGKPIIGLETVEFQIKLFDGLNQKEADELVQLTLQEIEETPNTLTDLIAAWKEGDIKTLDDLLSKHFEPEHKLTKRIIHDRNRDWIPFIEKELKSTEGNAMFIVGAGHLVGFKSVIEMLQKKGYTIEQL